MHGHLAFWGAYGMIVFAIITYVMPNVTGRKIYNNTLGNLAFWISLIGMLGMVAAFGAMGVAQVTLERRLGLDFMTVQKELHPHFWVLVITASIFTIGILLYVWNFIRYGLPTDSAIGVEDEFKTI